MSDREPIDELELDQGCPACGAKGGKTIRRKGVANQWVACEVCRGKGRIPTHLGEQVLDFVRKYLFRG